MLNNYFLLMKNKYFNYSLLKIKNCFLKLQALLEELFYCYFWLIFFYSFINVLVITIRLLLLTKCCSKNKNHINCDFTIPHLSDCWKTLHEIRFLLILSVLGFSSVFPYCFSVGQFLHFLEILMVYTLYTWIFW